MNIEKMSDSGAADTVNEICDGLKEFIARNPGTAKELLTAMVEDLLEPLTQDDFFGTEGWEHPLGVS